MSAENPQAQTPLARTLELLDFAQAHARGQRLGADRAALRPRSRLSFSPRREPIRQASNPSPPSLSLWGSYALVPPTVIPSIRIVGSPTPTGTDCPSLPQVPIPESRLRSLPTILTRVSTSGPLPISVAPLTGRVISAVLDQVGLARGEHELAVGDIDLTAAEAHRVEALADRLENVLGVCARRRA